jgi:hypothetical protein
MHHERTSTTTIFDVLFRIPRLLFDEAERMHAQASSRSQQGYCG